MGDFAFRVVYYFRENEFGREVLGFWSWYGVFGYGIWGFCGFKVVFKVSFWIAVVRKLCVFGI